MQKQSMIRKQQEEESLRAIEKMFMQERMEEER